MCKIGVSRFLQNAIAAFFVVFFVASGSLSAQSFGAFDKSNYTDAKKFHTPSGVCFDTKTSQDGEYVWSDITVKTKQNKIFRRHKALSGAPFFAADGHLFVLPVSPQYNPRHCYIFNADGTISKKIDVSKYEIVDFVYVEKDKLFCIIVDKFDNNTKKHVFKAIGYGVDWEFSSEVPVVGNSCEFRIQERFVKVVFKLP